jgi:steroid delta-isomerase-like uncharacterized protein
VSMESNKAVVRRFIAEIWNAGNLAAANDLVHPEYTISGIGTGPDAVRHNVSVYRTAFPDLEWVVEQLIAEGDWVAVRLTLRGTHLGPLGDIPASGKPVTMKEMVFWRVDSGQLREIWSQGDALGLRIQIGAIPASAWDTPIRSFDD